MTPEERRRAGQAVLNEIGRHRTTRGALAAKAHVDPKTLRAVIEGAERPRATPAILARIEEALGWPVGEITRRGQASEGDAIESATETRLLVELLRRATLREEASTSTGERQEDADDQQASRAAQRRRGRGTNPGKL